MHVPSSVRVALAAVLGASGILLGAGAAVGSITSSDAVETEVAAELIGVWKAPSGGVYAIFSDYSMELLGYS